MTRTTVSAVMSMIFTGLLFSAWSQNARIDAMGGASIVPDYSKVHFNPAVMNDYRDNAEITFNGGAIMATKSMGTTFSAGVVMNRGLQLRYFYSGADSTLDFFSGSGVPSTPSAQYFPHLLWGFNLDILQIGFDTYLEWNRATYHSLVEVPGAFQEADGELIISHPGCIAGFKLNLNSVSLMFHIGGGMPSANATLEQTNIAPVGTAKIETETGLFGRAGAELTLRMNKTAATFGVDGRYEAFQFSELAATPGAQKVRSDITSIKTATPYLGITSLLANNVLVVGMGRSSIDILQNETDAGSETETDYLLRHSLIGGFEKLMVKPWKFDSLALRGGVSWGSYSTWSKYKSTTVPVTQETYKPITTLGPAYPYFGFGASKGFFSADLLLNPASWTGALMGPAVSRVTVTLKY